MEGVTVEKAAEVMRQYAAPIVRTEEVMLFDTPGRVLAQDMISQIDNPPFDRSPIDGYACRSKDIREASKQTPVLLSVIGEVDAGGYMETGVCSGQAVRIMTGAPVPEGCDCCVRQESTDYGENTVCIYEAVRPWGNYCYRGEDFKKGSLMVRKGTRLSYAEAGILASMGKERVLVYQKPKIALLTTGDEVVNPGEELAPGKIYNSNQTMLAVRMRELGIPPFMVQAVPDEPALMAAALKSAAEKADVIVTTGGVSVGKKDIMHEALPLLGAERIFWRVLLKPGTPTIFSVYKGIPIISLSGNPFGAAANFELLIRPMLAKMTHDETLLPVKRTARMADTFAKASPGRRFIRAICKDGRVYMPEGLHSSGVLSSLSGCNCMVDIPSGNKGLWPGDEVQVVVL
ncbi:MAG: molybdopterin molybdotransferase MoeA [Eubacteriales bacterium]|nr:molybdopterin molybdotransferase MoeA [Eubacteriales bacterium]